MNDIVGLKYFVKNIKISDNFQLSRSPKYKIQLSVNCVSASTGKTVSNGIAYTLNSRYRSFIRNVCNHFLTPVPCIYIICNSTKNRTILIYYKNYITA